MVGESQDSAKFKPGYRSGDILIEDLKVAAEKDNLLLDFRLVNNTRKDRLLSGYLLIIVEHRNGQMSDFLTFPEFELSPGEPLNYRLGDTYAIRNFKNVTAAVPLGDHPTEFTNLKFLVFNEEGGLLLYDNRALQW